MHLQILRWNEFVWKEQVDRLVHILLLLKGEWKRVFRMMKDFQFCYKSSRDFVLTLEILTRLFRN